MKLNLLERTVTCCLVGAATIAIASGWKRADPPEGDGVRAVSFAGFEKSTELEAEEPALAEYVARILPVRLEENDDTAEQELDKLVRAVEKASGAEKEVRRKALQEALTKVFRERTEAQRTRIAEMKERLNGIDAQLDRRSKLEDQIVQRRLGELLGDRDELSWDHEPALESLEIAERRRESREPIERAHEYLTEILEFPKEYRSLDRSAASGGQSRSSEIRMQQHRAMQLAEKKAADAAKGAREAQNAAARAEVQARSEMDRIRDAKEKDANFQEVRSRLNVRGSLLEGPILESVRGRESEALRAELAAVRAQSEMLKKQLEELSKQKSEVSKPLERP